MKLRASGFAERKTGSVGFCCSQNQRSGDFEERIREVLTGRHRLRLRVPRLRIGRMRDDSRRERPGDYHPAEVCRNADSAVEGADDHGNVQSPAMTADSCGNSRSGGRKSPIGQAFASRPRRAEPEAVLCLQQDFRGSCGVPPLSRDAVPRRRDFLGQFCSQREFSKIIRGSFPACR